MRKKFLFFGLVAITAFNFMSCDDEDENNNGNTTNNGGGTTSNLSAEFVGVSDFKDLLLMMRLVQATRAMVQESYTSMIPAREKWS